MKWNPIRSPNLGYYCFVWLVIAYSIANCFWLAHSDQPYMGDSPYYLHGAMRLQEALAQEGIGGLRILFDLVDFRPPLQSILAYLFSIIAGVEIVHASYLHALWFGLTAFLLLWILNKSFGILTGGLAMFWWMSNPFLIRYLNHYETEIPNALVLFATACVGWLWLQTPKRSYAALLGVLTGIGLMFKWLFAVGALGVYFALFILIVFRYRYYLETLSKKDLLIQAFLFLLGPLLLAAP